IHPRRARSMRSRAASPTRSPPFRADVRVLCAALLLLQGPRRVDRPDLRAGLDTLYGGGFPAAAGYFAELARRDSADPAPVIFEASAYIWWAAALENDGYEMTRIDSLLDRAIARAVAAPRGPGDPLYAPRRGGRRPGARRGRVGARGGPGAGGGPRRSRPRVAAARRPRRGVAPRRALSRQSCLSALSQGDPRRAVTGHLTR